MCLASGVSWLTLVLYMQHSPVLHSKYKETWAFQHTGQYLRVVLSIGKATTKCQHPTARNLSRSCSHGGPFPLQLAVPHKNAKKFCLKTLQKRSRVTIPFLTLKTHTVHTHAHSFLIFLMWTKVRGQDPYLHTPEKTRRHCDLRCVRCCWFFGPLLGFLTLTWVTWSESVSLSLYDLWPARPFPPMPVSWLQSH